MYDRALPDGGPLHAVVEQLATAAALLSAHTTRARCGLVRSAASGSGGSCTHATGRCALCRPHALVHSAPGQSQVMLALLLECRLRALRMRQRTVCVVRTTGGKYALGCCFLARALAQAHGIGLAACAACVCVPIKASSCVQKCIPQRGRRRRRAAAQLDCARPRACTGRHSRLHLFALTCSGKCGAHRQ